MKSPWWFEKSLKIVVIIQLPTLNYIAIEKLI